MARQLARSLEVLLTHSIDYAGIFPPASLNVETAVENYTEYSRSKFAWMLGRLVISPECLSDPVVKTLLGASHSSGASGVLAVTSDVDHAEASCIESKAAIAFGKPTYCEVPEDQLIDVLCVGSSAKIRMGGLTAGSIPQAESVANFIHVCVKHRLSFKATAGLHHPIRSLQPLTYRNDGPLAMVHGFINLLVASGFAWRGGDVETTRMILEETDAAAFRFEDARACWRDRFLVVRDLKEVRQAFIHSFGSCSFTDPVHDLQELGWL